MAEPRKLFRIEQTAAVRLEDSIETSQGGLRHDEIMRELQALRVALSIAAPRRRSRTTRGEPRDVARLASELNLIADAIRGNDDNAVHAGGSVPHALAASTTQSARMGHELNAVVNGTERATQKILVAAEAIDSVANTLSAALKGKIEQDLAHDISDQVIRIFEACNFQDLIGQRISKVMVTLKFVEDNIANVLNGTKTTPPPGGGGAPSLHGPRLDSDSGHLAQSDIDAMFGG